MAVTVADLVAKLSLDVSGVDKGVSQLKTSLGQVENGLKGAGKSLDDVRPPMERFDKKTQDTGRSLYEATHLSRLMSEQLLTQLNPALGSVVQASTMAARGFQGFSVGMAAIAVGGAATVAVLAQMIAKTVEASKAQAEFNIAVRSADLSSLRQQLQAYILELEQIQVRQQNVFGKIFNFMSRGFDFLLGGKDPTVASAERIAAVGKFMEEFGAPLQNARQALEEFGAARTRVGQQMAAAAQANEGLRPDIAAFDRYAAQLRTIIDLERQAADVVAEVEHGVKLRAATERAAGDTEIGMLKKELDSQLVLNKAKADAATMSLRLQTQGQRPAMQETIRQFTKGANEAIVREIGEMGLGSAILEPPGSLQEAQDAGRRAAEAYREGIQTTIREAGEQEHRANLDIVRELQAEFGIAPAVGTTAEGTEAGKRAVQERREQLHDLQQAYENALESSKALADVTGGSFDRLGADIAATQAQFVALRNVLGDADARVQDLGERLRDLSNIRERLGMVFDPLRTALSGTLQGIIQGTQTLGQAFANMGRNIAASLVENVINKGLTQVQRALEAFIRELQETGLLKSALMAGANALIGVGSAAVGGGAGVDTGAAGVFQHGGITHGPSIAGEAGPEAIVPLPNGMAIPVALSGDWGGGTSIVINNYTNDTVEHSERTGEDGRRIHEFVIASVKRGAASGELESVFGGFGGRRVPMQR